MGLLASDFNRCPEAKPDASGPAQQQAWLNRALIFSQRVLRYGDAVRQCFGAIASFGAGFMRLSRRLALRITKVCPETDRWLLSSIPWLGLASNVHLKGVSPEVPLEITLQHTGGARFVAEARKHRLVIDQPAEDGATDRGMSPSELLLVALGSCIGQYVAQYLSLRGLSSDGLQISVGADRSTRPLRLSGFRVEVAAPELTGPQLRALEKTLATAGLVHGAISQENPVRITAGSVLAAGEAD